MYPPSSLQLIAPQMPQSSRLRVPCCRAPVRALSRLAGTPHHGCPMRAYACWTGAILRRRPWPPTRLAATSRRSRSALRRPTVCIIQWHAMPHSIAAQRSEVRAFHLHHASDVAPSGSIRSPQVARRVTELRSTLDAPPARGSLAVVQLHQSGLPRCTLTRSTTVGKPTGRDRTLRVTRVPPQEPRLMRLLSSLGRDCRAAASVQCPHARRPRQSSGFRCGFHETRCKGTNRLVCTRADCCIPWHAWCRQGGLCEHRSRGPPDVTSPTPGWRVCIFRLSGRVVTAVVCQ